MRVCREEREKTKEKILVETLPSLKVWGQSAAPVDKIMKRLGLTSGALYSHFKSKENLFAQVVLREIERLILYHQLQIQHHGSGAIFHFIEFYLNEKHLNAIERGCMFVALGPDLHRLKLSTKRIIEVKMESLFSVLAEGFPKGTRRIRLAKARFVFSSLVGALIFARSMKTSHAKSAILKSTKHHLLKISETE